MFIDAKILLKVSEQNLMPCSKDCISQPSVSVALLHTQDRNPFLQGLCPVHKKSQDGKCQAKECESASVGWMVSYSGFGEVSSPAHPCRCTQGWHL